MIEIPNPCRLCNSPNRGFADGMLRDGSPYRPIIEELDRRGEKYLPQNLSRHKPHVKQADEVKIDEGIEQTVAALREEAAHVTPMLRAQYQILIAYLESVAGHNKTPSARDAISAVESITRLTGRRTEQEMLLAFAERAWAPGGAFYVEPSQRLDATGAYAETERHQGPSEDDQDDD